MPLHWQLPANSIANALWTNSAASKSLDWTLMCPQLHLLQVFMAGKGMLQPKQNMHVHPVHAAPAYSVILCGCHMAYTVRYCLVHAMHVAEDKISGALCHVTLSTCAVMVSQDVLILRILSTSSSVPCVAQLLLKTLIWGCAADATFMKRR